MDGVGVFRALYQTAFSKQPGRGGAAGQYEAIQVIQLSTPCTENYQVIEYRHGLKHYNCDDKKHKTDLIKNYN